MQRQLSGKKRVERVFRRGYWGDTGGCKDSMIRESRPVISEGLELRVEMLWLETR